MHQNCLSSFGCETTVTIWEGILHLLNMIRAPTGSFED